MHAGQKGIATNGFVQELWIGGVPVREAWCEGVKLYPDERTVVRDIVLGAVDDHYWLHAMDAAGKGKSEMVMTLGGRQFHLYHGDGTLPILPEVGGAFRASEFDDILLSDCIDATVTVSANVPSRTSEQAKNDELVLDVPWLPGSKVMARWSKGKKRKWAGCAVRVTGLSSGTVHCAGSCETSQHKRGWKSHLMPDDTHKWYNAVWKDELVAEDRKLHLWCQGVGSSGDSGRVEVIFPAFERSWQLKVLGVTLQHKVN